MAEKRTLGDAMLLTPQKVAFIEGKTERQNKLGGGYEEKVTKSVHVLADNSSERDNVQPTPTMARRRRSPSGMPAPRIDEVLNEVLMPLTTRLPHRLVQSLRRLCLEQRLIHAKPDSIQEIVEMAVEEWISKHLK